MSASELRLDAASGTELESIALWQAEHWRGPRSAEQYLERNRRLAATPFGGRALAALVLRDASGAPVTSMEALEVRLSAPGGPRRAFLIGSVVTPPALRGRGHARRMLELFLEERRRDYHLLFSDIGAAYYEPLGFRAFPAGVVETEARKVRPPRAERASLGAFLRGLEQARAASHALLHDRDQYEWVLERYRFYAECAGRVLPADLFWRAEDGHFLSLAPDFGSSRLDALWIHPWCEPCADLLHAQAARWGLRRVRYWERSRRETSERSQCPMLRVPEGAPPGSLSDLQPCDYW